jgi:predicted  nucleic acid-binding Zn-ribbon protein
MRDEVRTLLQVQEVDAELMELETRRGEIPLQRAALLQEEGLLQAEADAVRERLKVLLLEGRERESEMRSQEDRAVRYQGQLAAVSTNKEYLSLLSEIKGVKERVSAAEDRALAILEESEQLRARAAELEAEIIRSRESSAEQRDELDREEARLAEEVAVRRDRRSILAGRVGQRLLGMYESILRRGRRLPVLVPLRGLACSNCFGTLPLQAASEIRRQEQPCTCEHCGVILYVPEGEAGAF